jgi:hypothetical protein
VGGGRRVRQQPVSVLSSESNMSAAWPTNLSFWQILFSAHDCSGQHTMHSNHACLSTPARVHTMLIYIASFCSRSFMSVHCHRSCHLCSGRNKVMHRHSCDLLAACAHRLCQ